MSGQNIQTPLYIKKLTLKKQFEGRNNPSIGYR
jgi:hypothetical protein